MVNEKPDVKKNARYNVKETAKLLGIHRNTLQNHTDKGHITAHIHKATGRKFYTGEEIVRFWYLYI